MATPSYLISADTHNLAADADKSMFDTLGDAASSVANFTALSVGAGVNEIYNIVPTVGNWFGADMEKSDYKEQVRAYDDDLMKYYEDHKQGVDIAGFVLGSVVPGLGGTKVLNVGQAALRGAIQEGRFGVTTGKALGLLAPSKEKALSAAIGQLGEAGSVVSLTEANTLRALGAGFGEQALNAFAWETTVAATMSQSPILNEMSTKDLMWNIAVGTAIGGGIGGIMSGVGTAWSLKKAASGIQQELAPWSMTTAPSAALSPIEKAMSWKNAIDTTLEVPADFNMAARATALREQTIDKMWLNIRSELKTFAGDDEAVAQTLFEHIKTSNTEDAFATYLSGKNAGRISSRTATESKLIEIESKIKKAGFQGITDDEAKIWGSTEVSYLKVWGENGSKALDERPAILSLTDKFTSLEAKTDGIYGNGKKIYGHENNPHKPFNILGVDHYQVESRYLWAEKFPSWNATDDIMIHQNDLPLMEKAFLELDSVKVIPESGRIADAYSVTGKDSIKALLESQKRDIASKLTQSRAPVDSQVIADKLQAYFGVNINVVDSKNFLGRWMQTAKDKAGLRWESIELSRNALQRKNLMKIVSDLSHERGHSMFQAMMRGLSHDFKDTGMLMRTGLPADMVDSQFAAVANKLRPELMQLSKRIRPDHWKQAQRGDLAAKEYLTQAHEMMADSFAYFAQHPEQLDKFPQFKAYAGHLIKPIPQEVKDMLSTRAMMPTQEEIAKIVNARSGWLDGSLHSDSGWNARNEFRSEYAAKMKQAGTRANEQMADPLMLPQHIKIVSDTSAMKSIDGNVLDGMTYIAQKEQLFTEEARRNIAQNLGEIANTLPAWSSKSLMAGTNEGPSLAGFANANPGSSGSIASYIGQRTHAIIKELKDATLERLNPALSRLGNDQAAAIEWSVLNERIRQSPYRYILSEDGLRLTAKLSPEDMARKAADGDAWLEIPIKNANTQAVVMEHLQLNAKRQQGLQLIKTSEGVHFRRDPNEFYPIPRNPKDTPFFAYVVDDSITGVGHNQMLYAASEADLEALKQMAKQQRPDLKILTKGESESYFKAHGQFSFEKSLNEKLIDVSKMRAGTSASFMPKTDPSKIVSETLDWHLARDSAYARENISHLYNKQFSSLTAAGDSMTQASKSKFGYVSPLSHAETAASNPPNDLIKMALDVSKREEYPRWNTFQQQLDEKITQVWGGFTKLFRDAKSPEDLAGINQHLKEAGYGGPLVMSDKLYEASNKVIEKGALSSFVNKANALISTFALRLDVLNAVNNAVGSQVLLNTELRSLIRAIGQGNEEAAGELAKLGMIQAPGTNQLLLSPTKLIANSISRFHTDKAARAWAKEHGFVSSISDQYDQSLDLMANTIRNGKINDAFHWFKKTADKGELWTGNKLAEEFNRFVAADVMKQITDLAVKSGAISSQREALSYINTFVNRTQGNYLASQRPLMFQGPVGQAIGLFQTYQFNLIQQLLRHVGEGDAKAAVTMMGLQGSIYGMQGLPAFNAINTHIIGNAAGNTDHTDLYKAVYSGVGKEAGDWLTYGAASNVLGLIHPDLKNNLYTRGDINPRHLFVIPTNPADLPIYTATAKVLGNMLDTAGKIMQGGAVVETVLRGLEHNGISRPLTGLAQIVEGAYSGKGVRPVNNAQNILMSHELASLASLTRLAGGKPLDEALVQDAMFRFTAYRAKDRAMRDSLGETVKLDILSGKEISQDNLEGFAEAYHKAGGKQTEFAQFMARQYRNTNAPQAEQLREKLSSPYSMHLQNMMGGMKFQTAVEQSPE
mgnify:CR=1 FL=1